MTTEIWKPIPNYPGYEASSLGRIRSFKRGEPRVLKQSDNGQGYLQVGICNSNSTNVHRVHTLIALAFLGPRPDGLVCCHNDGDKLNNRPENLRYDTQKSNIMDAVLAGSMGAFSKEQVAEIRTRFNNGASGIELSNEYGVSAALINQILHNRIYQWVDVKANVTKANKKALAIRQEYATGKVTYTQLAKKYNLDQSGISLIVNGKRHAKAGGPIKGVDYQ